jgi:hypothetical protein
LRHAACRRNRRAASELVIDRVKDMWFPRSRDIQKRGHGHQATKKDIRTRSESVSMRLDMSTSPLNLTPGLSRRLRKSATTAPVPPQLSSMLTDGVCGGTGSSRPRRTGARTTGHSDTGAWTFGHEGHDIRTRGPGHSDTGTRTLGHEGQDIQSRGRGHSDMRARTSRTSRAGHSDPDRVRFRVVG